MTDVERIATRATGQIRNILQKVSSLMFGVVVLTLLVGSATFATGLWIFDGNDRAAWVVIGGIVCAAPVVAAVVGWLTVRSAARVAPRFLDDVRGLLSTSRDHATVLIGLDGEQNIVASSKSLGGLRREVDQRRRDYPALWVALRAITRAPGLAAIAVLGFLAVGALGTILLVGGLID